MGSPFFIFTSNIPFRARSYGRNADTIQYPDAQTSEKFPNKRDQRLAVHRFQRNCNVRCITAHLTLPLS